jgi:hypothetical protein
MAGIRRAHPGFFQIDYQDYYALHCETVRHWVAAAERKGKHVINLTPSHIPALAARRPAGLTAPARKTAWPFFLRCKAAYAWRALQMAYGRVLAAAAHSPWLLRILRTPVRELRAALTSHAR